MKKREALAILRDARRVFDTAHRLDKEICASVVPISDCHPLALYYLYGNQPDNIDSWRWNIFPLYQALMMAGPSLYKAVNQCYPKHSLINKFRILIRVSIQILHEGKITWPTTIPQS